MITALPPSLRARLNFTQATKDEVRDPIDTLPSRIVERAVDGHEGEFSALIEARASQTIDVQPAETVWVPKAAAQIGRYRPVTALGPDDRVLLRALSNEVLPHVEPFDRSFEAQQAFQRFPLESGAPYVVIADVSAFYFFVDHELLASRVIDQTAHADTAEAIRSLLDGLIARPYGLPQNFAPSMPLSEVFIGPVERRLRRAGIVTYRANDDFRLCADTWGDALQALERLQEEVNRVGLVLNDEKSWILKLDTYTRNLGLVHEIFTEALTSADPDFPDIDPYSGEPVASEEDDEANPEDEDWSGLEDPEEVPDEGLGDADEVDSSDTTSADAALRLFEHAAKQRMADQQMSGFERAANRQALQVALHLLTQSRSEAGVDLGARMVAIDPLLARPYVGYLRVLSAEGPATAQRVHATLNLFRGHAPFWTQAWLANALLDPRVTLTDAIRSWLQDMLVSRAPAVLRIRAALALAFHGDLSATEIGGMLDGLPVAARPDAVAAMAFAGRWPTSSPSPTFEDDLLLRWVHELASKHREDPGPLL